MSFERDVGQSAKMLELLQYESFARAFYAGLCNRTWKKVYDVDEEHTLSVLRGESREYSCSWRHAGGFIAQLRNDYYNTNEDYMDYYCSGNEGHLAQIVKDALEEIGWVCGDIYDDEL